MKYEQILEASNAVGWLADQAGSPGARSHECAEMALLLRIAETYMTEYALHASRGAEPYDALMSAARGELKLTASEQDVWRALRGPRAPE